MLGVLKLSQASTMESFVDSVVFGLVIIEPMPEFTDGSFMVLSKLFDRLILLLLGIL